MSAIDARPPPAERRPPLGMRSPAVGLRPRSVAVLVIASLGGLAMFGWPLIATPSSTGMGHTSDAPLVFVLVLPVLVAVVLAELSEGGMDTKALALLGVLSAVGAMLRPLGAGTAGVQLLFAVLVLAGRVFGPGFGFTLGATTLFASALLTAGVGPWLPFQMMASAWVGLGAGLLPFPRLRGRREIALLAAWAAVSALLYGLVMNLWAWPYALLDDTGLGYVAGDAVLDNLRRFLLSTVATSSLGWDLGRAISNVLAIVLAGPAVLGVLRRAARRASFGAAPTFDDVDPPTPTDA